MPAGVGSWDITTQKKKGYLCDSMEIHVQDFVWKEVQQGSGLGNTEGSSELGMRQGNGLGAAG